MDKYTLHEKVLNGDLYEVKAAILQCNNIDELDNFGYSPLHWAVINKQTDIVKLLLEAGADVNVTSYDGFTPEDNAIDFGFKDIEYLLLRYKACHVMVAPTISSP
jgi:ankyrin repeat protein